MSRIAYLTCLTGQDSSYLCELLLQKDYIVYGMIRRHSGDQGERIEHIKDRLHIMYGDLTDQTSLNNALATIRKEQGTEFSVLEIYHLGAMSHVKVSFEIPIYTTQVDAVGTLHVLEAIRQCGYQEKIRLYNAASSEMFGDVLQIPQDEKTPFNPVSPYAISKVYSYFIVKNYRESYGIHACSGILFNHTSPRRPPTFVVRKITSAVAAIHEGKQNCLYLGNLNSKRDIGHSRDFVLGMWLMVQKETPSDYVLSTGETYSIRELVQMAFGVLNKEVTWRGKGLEEVGIVEDKIVVRVDPQFFRPSEVNLLLGNSSKARTELGWLPKYTTQEIVKEMIEYDLKRCHTNKRRWQE